MRISYELHAQSKGMWNIERVYDGGSKEEALTHARHLYAEPQVSGVKVVCETYNEETNQSSEVVIYDTTRESGKPVEVKKAQPAAAASTAKPAAQEPQGGIARPQAKKPAKKPMSTFGLAALSIVLITAVAVLAIAVTRGAEVIRSL